VVQSWVTTGGVVNTSDRSHAHSGGSHSWLTKTIIANSFKANREPERAESDTTPVRSVSSPVHHATSVLKSTSLVICQLFKSHQLLHSNFCARLNYLPHRNPTRILAEIFCNAAVRVRIGSIAASLTITTTCFSPFWEMCLVAPTILILRQA
jgi:hypothetical protein